jgi:hypothetical protein
LFFFFFFFFFLAALSYTSNTGCTRFHCNSVEMATDKIRDEGVRELPLADSSASLKESQDPGDAEMALPVDSDVDRVEQVYRCVKASCEEY